MKFLFKHHTISATPIVLTFLLGGAIPGLSAPITGTDGDDTLIGTDFDDVFIGTPGSDYIDGGAHTLLGDTIDYSGSNAAIELYFSGNGDAVGIGGYADSDHISNIEKVIGSEFDDIIFGDDRNFSFFLPSNIYEGGGGNDYIDGRGGSDLIMGNDGRDVLIGGDGNDTLIGGKGGDALVGGEGFDTVDYSASEDGVVLALEATDSYGIGSRYMIDSPIGGVSGDAEDDWFESIEKVVGSRFNDAIYGVAAPNGSGTLAFLGDGDDIFDNHEFRISADVICGGNGDDHIWTGDGPDVIEGGPGNEIIYAEGGKDEIIGGAGDDFLSGGVGDDFFSYYSTGYGNDVISDFNRDGHGSDTLLFSSSIFKNSTEVLEAAKQVGGDVIIVDRHQSSIRLRDYLLASFSEKDIIIIGGQPASSCTL
ncbi:calcium-binding protein [Microbulbifer pacificus]|uniref:calcium-binding protein n=1 Tax=Microbulbifer pacificus TaxID=407164 RepID=UPI00131A45F3|nr:calcium-binding protein [Microbulbifer pacificus]